MKKLALEGGQKALSEPLRPFNSYDDKESAAAKSVVENGLMSGFHGSPQKTFFGGEHVLAFENAFKEKFQAKHAVSVNSATSGLIAALGAIGLGPGDEVIVPPYTMSATAVAALFYGGVPRFVDIEPQTFCLSLEQVKQAINPNTKAIIAVNLFGHPAHLSALRALADAHNVFLIEDNAQAIGAHEHGTLTGNIGHLGVYSFNIHKHMQVGEGGMVTTSCPMLAQRLQLIRNHGENVIDWLNIEDITNLIGYNFRLSEIHAAIATEQLKKVDRLVQRCQDIGHTLSERLDKFSNLMVPMVREGCSHSYFMWTAQVDASRDWIANALKAEGIPVAVGYVCPLYRLPVFAQKRAIGKEGFPFNLRTISYCPADFPVVEHCHYQSVIQIQPVSWDITPKQLDEIIHGFEKVFAYTQQQSELAPC